MAVVSLLLILVYLASLGFHVKGAGFDLTCFNENPMLKPDETENTFIGGYKGGSDFAQINVDFNRPADVGTGSGLPTGSTQTDSNGGRGRRLNMPLVGGIERIGAFNCEGEQHGIAYNITSIITHYNGDPQSLQTTITANPGDRVVLEVTRDDTSKHVTWNIDGQYNSDWDDQTTLVIESVNVDDAGVYECYYQGERNLAIQAIIRLIVRGCSARFWNPPECKQNCIFCYNGGVCDDMTGDCICAPGFAGINCNQSFGRNTFGQEGDHRCSESLPNVYPGCRGKQLCALDPYGCSCVAGFTGKDCLTDCPPGSYGADCKQTCHCVDGPSSCEYATGTCAGLCSSGWRGDNCQETGVRELLVLSSNSTSISVSWTSPVTEARFAVGYKLTLIDQCQPTNLNPITLPARTGTSVIITDLIPFSTYEITVTSDTWPPCLQNEAVMTTNTDKSAPSQVPPNLRETVQQETSLTFQWDPIQCGNRGGDNIMYEYLIDTTPQRTGTTSGTLHTEQNLDPCTTYEFKVNAVNLAGGGPETSIDAATKYTAPAGVDRLTVSGMTGNPGQLLVDWDQTPCADSYSVQYRKDNGDQCLNTNGSIVHFWDGQDTSVVLSGLEAYTTYEVSVLSKNDIGTGKSSKQGVTDIVAPLAAPENVTHTSRTNTSLTFEWARVPCGQRGGPNNFIYELSDIDGSLINNDSTTNLYASIFSLESCKMYKFVVKAFNDAGQGDYSVQVLAETDVGVLGSIRNLNTDQITSNMWTLSWDPQDDSLCETDQFIIEYTLTNKDQCENISYPERVVFGNVIDERVEITGLDPYSDYITFIVPSNGYGRGEESLAMGTTLESAPTSHPQNLEVKDVGNNYIAYSWEQPLCGHRNGVILQYFYTLSTLWKEGYTTATSVNIFGLNPCTSYTFVVYAETSVGRGYGAANAIITEPEVPHPPSDLTQLEQCMERMTVSWKPPSPAHCEIISYSVTRRTINKPYEDGFEPLPDPEKEKDVEGTRLDYTFVDLQPSTEYEIQVWASTVAGRGELIQNAFYTAAANTVDYLGDPLPKPDISDSTGSTVKITIPQVDNPEQYVTEYRILVEQPNTPASVNSPDFNHKTHVAGRIDVHDVASGSVEFIVGDGSEDSNPPLDKGTKYIIFIGTCSAISETVAGCIWSQGLSYQPGNEGSSSDVLIWILFTTLTVTLLIAVSTVAVWFYRKKQQLQQQVANLQIVEMDPYTNLGLVSEPGPYEDLNTAGTISRWDISWSQLTISDKILGSGNFGEVRAGLIDKGHQQQQVAVKSLKSNAEGKDKADFNSEFETMKCIGYHPNVVSLIGACENEGTLHVAIEFVSFGDLRTYLRTTRRRDQRGASQRLPSARLLTFAFDVAKGMDHLSKLGIIHRDLAARNILLDDDLVAKVSDFGMSRGENVYVKTSKQRVPTRWLAIESLYYNIYTTKSDVWSFAVLLWEIATLGATPYSGIASRDLPNDLSEGYRMPKPASLDKDVYALMLECWNQNPKDRPTFAQLAKTLSNMLLMKQRTYLDTKVYENIQFPSIEPDRDDN